MNDLNKRIEMALEEIRPFLNNDGGDIKLHNIINGTEAEVILMGACNECSVNQMTLTNGVEVSIKRFAPEITKVTHVHSPA
ncbi:MAG: Fe/S biogenesis protein NfuA [Owenweeksia sp. TMED14]|nr:MAG: Fe/S biogenesis protein NfuA [Owenweeksia sp. TMED14]